MHVQPGRYQRIPAGIVYVLHRGIKVHQSGCICQAALVSDSSLSLAANPIQLLNLSAFVSRLSERYQAVRRNFPYPLSRPLKNHHRTVEQEEKEMNRRMLLLLVLVFLIGCAPAQSPTQIAQEPLAAEARQPQPLVMAPARTRPPSPVEEEAGPIYPQGNTFQDYGANPEESPAWDHLSTFALDVDTASYTVARRYVNDGLLPPPEAVRIEEFVNFFQQDYPSPAGTAFGIYADGAPSPFSLSDEVVLRFGIQGYQPVERTTAGAHVCY
jgi:hypothetical protein